MNSTKEQQTPQLPMTACYAQVFLGDCLEIMPQIESKSIDLILSGSPCQDLSAAGKRAGINGSKSSLFFVFVDILEHIKLLNPNVLFLQENLLISKVVK